MECLSQAESAPRYQLAWRMRRDGCTYDQIATAIGGISKERARQIVLRADRRIAQAQQVYDGPVHDPIVYGIWHEFTHDGRERLPNTSFGDGRDGALGATAAARTPPA